MSDLLTDKQRETMLSILRDHAETSGVGHLRRCVGASDGDDLTGTRGDRKVIFPDHASAAAAAFELWRVLGSVVYPYKCSRAKRHHHLTSTRQGTVCACGEALT